MTRRLPSRVVSGSMRDRRGQAAQRRLDVVVDVTGRAGGLQRALELARPRGVVVMKTTSHDDGPFVSWPAVVNEVTLLGSRCGPFKPAIELLARGGEGTTLDIRDVSPISDAGHSRFARAHKILFAP